MIRAAPISSTTIFNTLQSAAWSREDVGGQDASDPASGLSLPLGSLAGSLKFGRPGQRGLEGIFQSITRIGLGHAHGIIMAKHGPALQIISAGEHDWDAAMAESLRDGEAELAIDGDVENVDIKPSF